MITLVDIIQLYSGGPGSGCHGPNCGRPRTAAERAAFLHKQFRGLKKQEREENIKKWVGEQIQKHGQVPTKAVQNWWRSEYFRQQGLKYPVQVKQPDLTKKQQKWLEKHAPKVGKALPPGITKYKGVERLHIAPVSKRQVKQQQTLADGTKLTVIKPPGQKEKTGQTWLIRESPYKGQFRQNFDVPAHAAFRANAKVAFFTARDYQKDRAVAVQVLRNFGEKAVSVTEIDLQQYDAMARSRQATFNNIGRAYGFLSKRYGIRFRLS